MESENNPPNEPGLVTVFRLAGGGTEEMEVLTVRQLLESNGINTVLVGDSPMPNLSEEIRVAEEDAERAQQVIADALTAGPAGPQKPRRNRNVDPPQPKRTVFKCVLTGQGLQYLAACPAGLTLAKIWRSCLARRLQKWCARCPCTYVRTCSFLSTRHRSRR